MNMATKLYNKSNERGKLVLLDQEITRRQDELDSLKRQNSKLSAKLPRVNLSSFVMRKVIEVMAEIELMKSKRITAEQACFDFYDPARTEPEFDHRPMFERAKSMAVPDLVFDS